MWSQSQSQSNIYPDSFATWKINCKVFTWKIEMADTEKVIYSTNADTQFQRLENLKPASSNSFRFLFTGIASIDLVSCFILLSMNVKIVIILQNQCIHRSLLYLLESQSFFLQLSPTHMSKFTIFTTWRERLCMEYFHTKVCQSSNKLAITNPCNYYHSWFA